MNNENELALVLLVNTTLNKFKEKVDTFIKLHGYRELISNKKLVDEFLSEIKEDNELLTQDRRISLIRIHDIYVGVESLKNTIDHYPCSGELRKEIFDISRDIEKEFTETIVNNFRYSVLFKARSKIDDLTPNEMHRILSIDMLLTAYENGEPIASFVELVNTFNTPSFFMMLALPQFVITEANCEKIIEGEKELRERFERVNEEINKLR